MKLKSNSFCKTLTRLAMATATITIAGCSVISPDKPTLNTYDISAPTIFSEISGSSNAQVLVKRPSSLKVLQSDRIVVRSGQNEVTYLPGVRLGDELPTVIQVKLAETLVNTQRIRAVGKPGDGLLIDYQIVSDLRSFELSNTGSGLLASGQIAVKLINDRNGVLNASAVFNATAPVGSAEGAAITALDQVFDKLASDIAAWIIKKL